MIMVLNLPSHHRCNVMFIVLLVLELFCDEVRDQRRFECFFDFQAVTPLVLKNNLRIP